MTDDTVRIPPLAEPADSRARRRSARRDSDRRATFALLCIIALLGAVAALSFLSGGFIFERTAPVVFVLAALTVAAVWLMRGAARPPRAYLIGLVAFTAFVVWAGLSILWSTGPDLSWVAFDVAALYLLAMAVLGLLPGGPLQLRVAAYGYAVVVAVVAVDAFLAKIAPNVATSAHLVARISSPVGYWNVLGAMIAMAVPILVTAGADRATPVWARGLASSGLVLLLFTLFFTFSRGADLALAAALLVYFVLSTMRLSALVSLLIPAALMGAVLFHLRHLETLFSATTDDALRTSQGHTLALWFAAALVVAFVAQLLVALAQRRWSLSPHQARTVGIVVIAVLVLLPVAAGAVYFPRHGGLVNWVSVHYHQALSSSGPANTASRLTSLGSNGRIPWFREALKGFSHHIVAGTGAGTFRFTNYLYRANPTVVMHSHSEWLNVLSELGLIGFVLFVVGLGGLVVAAFGRLFGDRHDPHRSLLAACQAAIVVFVLHISIDWDWDMAAITLAFLMLVGVSAAYVAHRRGERRVREAGPAPTAGGVSATSGPPRRPSLALRLLMTGVIVFGVVSWALPYLAQRDTDAAVNQFSAGRLSAAAASARQAARLDPLAVDPLLALSAAQAQQGDLAGAVATVDKAVKLQPDNYEPYYRMGTLLLYGYKDKAAAQRWFTAALRLNPLDPQTLQTMQALSG